ncbi:MAG: hypothetical protein FWB93_03365 [Oscillospiraceae bacterium]|nr:hypothetical protein [Oscillospiraceae bacterium]
MKYKLYSGTQEDFDKKSGVLHFEFIYGLPQGQRHQTIICSQKVQAYLDQWCVRGDVGAMVEVGDFAYGHYSGQIYWITPA